MRISDWSSDVCSSDLYAILNLNHRDGREPPKPLTPGERFKITVPLIEPGYSFLPGHRIRVAISTTYWPLIWPSPTPVKLTGYAGASSPPLPIRTAAGGQPVAFGPPEAAAPKTRTIQKSGDRRRMIHTAPLNTETLTAINDTPGRQTGSDAQ